MKEVRDAKPPVTMGFRRQGNDVEAFRVESWMAQQLRMIQDAAGVQHQPVAARQTAEQPRILDDAFVEAEAVSCGQGGAVQESGQPGGVCKNLVEKLPLQ